ncbi:ABC transporter ATP-binding protein [Flavonifractor plautii]|jgi:ABC-2 type transport system ATP-binding protein|uniref:ABC transporter ATP-binding protein n=1 Tax=Flavonifractor plautii TaxID=292800 RepID=UPI00189A6692|nr:ABC transporter ATP-binding protein [Flavonifractor plautii]MDB7881942.1 ABC transporter ATP-binding protein [Flavonifractor plautii]
MSVILKVENVSIQYKTGDFKDIGLKEWVIKHIKRQYKVVNFMAVNHVTFELEEGDMLGIIGTNGSGKSTLLKAVSGIMAPSEGTVFVQGNVAALLELGSGFDGNLTVKENAYLRGALLGYTKQLIDAEYEKVIEFAELKDFEGRPFNQLSSGMQARLAFSIASAIDPDVLILDEVLSVGDGAFQTKSAEKMKSIINGGATTILVSHSIEQIRSLCNKILWLHKGQQIVFDTNVKGVCDTYQAFLDGTLSLDEVITIYGTPV